MLKRTRTAGAAAALVGGALLLAGCSGQAATNSAVAPESQHGDTPGAADISASNCSAADFEYQMNSQPQTPGTFLLSMKNTSDKECRLAGTVNLKPTGMDGKTFEVATKDVDVPGPPEDSTVAPGKSVFAGVKVERADQGDPAASVATGFKATPTDSSGEADVNVVDNNGQSGTLEMPVKGLTIGSLQPSRQGVTVGL